MADWKNIMNEIDKAQFDMLRIVLLVATLVSLCFLSYIEWNTVRDSILQSQLEAEYAYDYACSPSSQIIKKAEYGEDTYIARTVWVNCRGLESDVGNFILCCDVEKSSPNTNRGLTVLRSNVNIRADVSRLLNIRDGMGGIMNLRTESEII